MPPPLRAHVRMGVRVWAQVWALRVDLHVIDHDGNLVDACCLAALAALMAFRKPETTLGGPSGTDVLVQPPEVQEPLPLTLHHLPVAVTYALFQVRAPRRGARRCTASRLFRILPRVAHGWPMEQFCTRIAARNPACKAGRCLPPCREHGQGRVVQRAVCFSARTVT